MLDWATKGLVLMFGYEMSPSLPYLLNLKYYITNKPSHYQIILLLFFLVNTLLSNILFISLLSVYFSN